MDISTTRYAHNTFPRYLKSILHPKYSIQATPSPVIVARSSKCPVSTNQFASILGTLCPDLTGPACTLHTKLVYEYIKGKDACMRRMFHPASYFLSPPSYLLPILPFAAHSLAGWQGVCGKRIRDAVV
jgi:hypothetical protein